VSFQQAYGHDLQEALGWCKKYSRSNKVSDLNQAWDLYYHVFRRINKQLPQMTTLELQCVDRFSSLLSPSMHAHAHTAADA
jgi:FKBP12-rapamycin complex-associated protein